MKLHEHFSLKKLNTMGVEALARYYLYVDELQALKKAFEKGWIRPPILVLGSGSNVLLTKNFPGTVLHVGIMGIGIELQTDDHVWIKTGAGVLWHDLVTHCMLHNYGGIENLSLIPGTVGAAPVQNIGAYGVELSDVFVRLTAFSLKTGLQKTFYKNDCLFGYRQSVFKQHLQDQYVILNVVLRLDKSPKLQLGYADVASALQATEAENPSVQDVSRAIVSIRNKKLPDPAHIGNAGSFFTNPCIRLTDFNRLKKTLPKLCGYVQKDGRIKIPAAALIEACGWRGTAHGCVGVHDQQALVLVHHGGGTGCDVLNLACRIQRSVQDRFKVHLEPEVRIL